jgi:ankyrin repeat protein/cytochrome c-type biogenesis protein CcmH/NrfG
MLSGNPNLTDAAMHSASFSRPILAAIALAAALSLSLPARADDTALATDDAGDVSLRTAEAALDNPERAGHRRLMRLTQALDQAARRKPDDVPTVLLAARAQVDYGGMSGQRRAHDLVEEVLRQDAKSIDALLLRSRLDWLAGCLPCAERSIQAARRIAPADAGVLAAQAGLYAGKGAQRLRDPSRSLPGEAAKDFYALAVREYEAAIAAQGSPPRRAALYEQIADIEAYRGHSGPAERALKKAVDLAPDRGSLLEEYASHLMYSVGDWKRASEFALKASVKGGSSHTRELQAAAMYSAWAEAFEADRAAGRSRDEVAGMLEAARKFWPDSEEMMIRATTSARTAPLARALLAAGLYSGKQGDYRDKDGDTPLTNLVLNYGRLQHDGNLARQRSELLDVADLLIADGANLNAMASEGGEPLLAAAARSGNAALFEKILKAGANPHLAGRSGTTGLFAVAALADYDAALRMAALLFERGVDVDRGDRARRTPLMLAAENGNTALATQLLKRGAQHDAHDSDDYTPLDYAASAGQRKMSELLLAAGAEIATQNSACGVSTTIDQAERRGHKDLADLLRQRRKVDL